MLGSAVNIVVSTGPASSGTPEIYGQIIAKGKGPSETLFVDLQAHRYWQRDAVNVQSANWQLRTICGKGTVTYNSAFSGKLPLKIGNIKKGASTTVRLFFNVPYNVTGFTFTESGTMQNTVGKNYNYSTTQTVTLCHEWGSPGHFGDCDHDDCGHKWITMFPFSPLFLSLRNTDVRTDASPCGHNHRWFELGNNPGRW